MLVLAGRELVGLQEFEGIAQRDPSSVKSPIEDVAQQFNEREKSRIPQQRAKSDLKRLNVPVGECRIAPCDQPVGDSREGCHHQRTCVFLGFAPLLVEL